jgi:hypothetical protein
VADLVPKGTNQDAREFLGASVDRRVSSTCILDRFKRSREEIISIMRYRMTIVQTFGTIEESKRFDIPQPYPDGGQGGAYSTTA